MHLPPLLPLTHPYPLTSSVPLCRTPITPIPILPCPPYYRPNLTLILSFPTIPKSSLPPLNSSISLTFLPITPFSRLQYSFCFLPYSPFPALLPLTHPSPITASVPLLVSYTPLPMLHFLYYTFLPTTPTILFLICPNPHIS